MTNFFDESKQQKSVQEKLKEIQTQLEKLSPHLRDAMKAIDVIECIIQKNPLHMTGQELNKFINIYNENLAKIKTYSKELNVYLDRVRTKELQAHLYQLEKLIEVCSNLEGLAKSGAPAVGNIIKNEIPELSKLISASASIINVANINYTSELADERSPIKSML